MWQTFFVHFIRDIAICAYINKSKVNSAPRVRVFVVKERFYRVFRKTHFQLQCKNIHSFLCFFNFLYSHPVCGFLQKKESKHLACSLLLFGDCFFCTRSVRFARIFVLDCCIFISVWFWQLYQQIAVQYLHQCVGFCVFALYKDFIVSPTFSTLLVEAL